MKKDFLDNINDLINEVKSETGDTIEKNSDLINSTNINGQDNKSDKSNDKNNNSKEINYHEGHRARMREKAKIDPDFMTSSDHQVLEFLLYNTIKRVDTNDLAHELIDTFGSFSGVLNASINELMTLKRINTPTASMLTSIIPAARIAEQSRLRNNVIINNTLSSVNYLQPFFMNRSVEMVYLVSINNNDRVINVDLISVGDTNYTTFDIKKIIETACRHRATKVLLGHNHPSGTLCPSDADKDVTSKLVVALMSMGIFLIDHIIFTSENYYSFFANHEFESIYEKVDSMFKTSLLQEVRSKQRAYKSGRYPQSFDDIDFKESKNVPKYSDDINELDYALGHPSDKSFIIKK